MKYYTLLLLITVATPNFGQDYLLEFDQYNSTYKYDWRGFESADEYETKLRFVEIAEQNDMIPGERRMLKMMDKELRFSVKAVDLNNDQKTDIIYSGPWGGEGNVVHFFIQENSTFKNIFTTRQGIVKVEWKGELMNKLYVHDWGCCADPNLTNYVYHVDYHDGAPNFRIIWESVELEEELSKPKQYFDQPKRFQIDNEIYKLRTSPIIDDKTMNYHLNITGNAVGILKKGFTGTAYGSSEDSTGRIWWYVTIDPDFRVEDTYINYSYHEISPCLIGWISSRYIIEL